MTQTALKKEEDRKAKDSMISYEAARAIILDAAGIMETERIPVGECAGRILGMDITAGENVPPFDRSPYDGYAFRAADTADASKEHPVTLRILEEIPAGGVSHFPVTQGTAVKILTGAPIPPGADAVTMFEVTAFTEDSVTVFKPSAPGENIIRAGEDVKKGTVLAKAGTKIDAGLCGTIAAQNIPDPLVYRRPVAGLLSTGSELLEPGDAPEPGKIFNSNRYSLGAELTRLGCETVCLGTVKDNAEEICQALREGLETCDVIVSTGGVSVGDYDLTEKAMEMAGIRVLLSGVKIKPGMACAYGTKDGKLVCALSGNPASSLINFHVIAAPAIRSLAGLRSGLWTAPEITVTMAEGFSKKSPVTRFLRGKLDLSDGTVKMHPVKDQGNVVLSGSIGGDVLALVPEGSGPVQAGSRLKAFLI